MGEFEEELLYSGSFFYILKDVSAFCTPGWSLRSEKSLIGTEHKNFYKKVEKRKKIDIKGVE